MANYAVFLFARNVFLHVSYVFFEFRLYREQHTARTAAIDTRHKTHAADDDEDDDNKDDADDVDEDFDTCTRAQVPYTRALAMRRTHTL